MSNAFNNKRVFLVVPHVPAGYLDIVGKRDDVRLDKLDNGKASETAKSILAAAHAYQTSSTRDELVRHYHTGAELLQHTPNLLIVSTNGAGYDTVDVEACSERGILVVNQAAATRNRSPSTSLACCCRSPSAWQNATARCVPARSSTAAISPAARCMARPSALSASAMSAGGSPNSAADCFAWRSLPTTLMSMPRRHASAAHASSNSTNFCTAPISSRSIAR